MKLESPYAQTTPRQFAETTFRNRYGHKKFGRFRKWLIVKLLEYQIKKSRKRGF